MVPTLRRLDCGWSRFDAPTSALRAMFPAATFVRMYKPVET